MESFFTAFGFAFGVVLLAEMGDKTQLLALAFATKYKAHKVMIGIFIAILLNHGLAVAVGNFITRFESIQLAIRGLASLSFIFFGLWTIKGDKQEGEENRTTKFGAVITVALVFFLGEMGDKTQLAAIAIATRFPSSPFAVLTGTVSAMMVTSALGIIVGLVLKKRIPEQKMKLISACVFIFFGLLGSYELISNELELPLIYIIVIMALIITITGIFVYVLIRKNKSKDTIYRSISP